MPVEAGPGCCDRGAASASVGGCNGADWVDGPSGSRFVVAGVIVVAVALGFALDATRWRLFLIGKKLRGEVKEVP
jgi:hypothetical protein